jgi:hypothetical protein
MKIPFLLPLLACVLLAQDASAQSRSSRSRGSKPSAVATKPLGSAERTKILERSKIRPEEARLGSAERRALLTGGRTSLYPKPKRPNHK